MESTAGEVSRTLDALSHTTSGLLHAFRVQFEQLQAFDIERNRQHEVRELWFVV
jgi:hypothetical protein